MKSNSIVADKSFVFAKLIVETYKKLKSDQKEFVLSKQLVRCGTSIGANVQEALGAQSDPDFLSKISIAYKEARECEYWIDLLHETNYLNQSEWEILQPKIKELIKILSSIQHTMQKKLKRK